MLQAKHEKKANFWSFGSRRAAEWVATPSLRGPSTGLTKGRHQGQAQVILRMLNLKFGDLSKAVVAKVEAGTEADFERWTERVLVATNLDQVFDDAPGA